MLGTKRVTIRLILLVFLSGIVLIGCTQPIRVSIPTDSLSAITPQATMLAQQMETQVSDQSGQKKGNCSSSGKVERYQIDSELMKGAFYFSVYFPPCYSPDRTDKYPVLYALHGQKFNDEMWIDLGMAEEIDRLVINGEVQPFLVVMPFEEFYYRGADGNNFPVALKDEIIPWVEGTLNACSEKACRAIGGISRGASWAIRIGLTEWDFFGSVGSHSLPTFKGDIGNLPGWLDAIPFGEEPRIYLDTGRFDPEVKTAYRFEQILNENGIPHDWHMNEGHHNEEYWRAHMQEYIRWYADGWDFK